MANIANTAEPIPMPILTLSKSPEDNLAGDVSLGVFVPAWVVCRLVAEDAEWALDVGFDLFVNEELRLLSVGVVFDTDWTDGVESGGASSDDASINESVDIGFTTELLGLDASMSLPISLSLLGSLDEGGTVIKDPPVSNPIPVITIRNENSGLIPVQEVTTFSPVLVLPHPSCIWLLGNSFL